MPTIRTSDSMRQYLVSLSCKPQFLPQVPSCSNLNSKRLFIGPPSLQIFSLQTFFPMGFLLQTEPLYSDPDFLLISQKRCKNVFFIFSFQYYLQPPWWLPTNLQISFSECWLSGFLKLLFKRGASDQKMTKFSLFLLFTLYLWNLYFQKTSPCFLATPQKITAIGHSLMFSLTSIDTFQIGL